MEVVMVGPASLIRRNQRILILALAAVVVIVAGVIVAFVAHPWNRAAAGNDSDDLQSRITANEQTWQKAGIPNYRITIKETRATLAPVSYTVVLTVQGGRIVDRQITDCQIAGQPCAADYPPTSDTDQYTVPGLFAYAHALATGKDPQTTIDFDPKYGYPRAITLPAVPDRGGSRVVTQFDPLP
jgi:Family of unknown function (DUF6174)